MAVSIIDPTPALVVIDLQKGLLDAATAHPLQEVVARSAMLARQFRRHGLPVVLVNATGAPPGRAELARRRGQLPPYFAELADELDAQPEDLRVSKQRWGAFTGTALDDELRRRGVTQVVITGVATSVGVESTARSAHDHGYHVVLATDAITDLDAEAHRHSVERIFPRLGETAAADEIVELLDQSR